jgi:hypothetical protein
MARLAVRMGTVLVLLMLSTSQAPQAQVAVYDAGNFIPNNISAFQSILTTIQTILIEANQILELTSLDDIALMADFASTVGQLQELMAEGQALMGDVRSAEAQITALFSPQDVPRTPVLLQQRVNDMQQAVFEARRYAGKVQSLVTTLDSLLGHVVTIAGQLGDLVGNKAGHQSVAQLQAAANHTAATQALQVAAFQRAEILQSMSRTLVVQSVNAIEADRWRGWPSW